MVRARVVLALAVSLSALAVPARAQEHEAPPPPANKWSFAGPFGKFDRAQLQRGFNVYREVCQVCHGLKLVAFRTLADPGGPGFTTAQATAIAAEYQVKGEPDDQGEVKDRPGRLADTFPPPFPNEQAARARYNAVPPDMSVIAKARGYERGFPRWVGDIFTQYQEQGVDYLTALMQGYKDAPPAGITIPPGNFYNEYFPGHAIAMPPPLTDKRVDYTDGAPMTVEQYAKDISAFLMWTAEPHLEARKRIGMQVFIFLVVLSGLLYFTKKKVWHAVELPPEAAPLRIGEIAGLPVVFLARHDKGHRLSPSDINYRANIDVLKRAGVTDLVSLSACGSYKQELPPGTFVVVDQFVDRTFNRRSSFFGKGCVAHVSMAHPVSPLLQDRVAAAARLEGIDIVRGGTYVCMEGPQFSTYAESMTYKGMGYSVVGMTNLPEAKLAREAELCYATVAMVTDFDCWHPDHDAVTVQDIIAVLGANADKARALVARLARDFPREHEPCPIGSDRALDTALITAPEARDKALLRKLDAVAGRVLKAKR